MERIDCMFGIYVKVRRHDGMVHASMDALPSRPARTVAIPEEAWDREVASAVDRARFVGGPRRVAEVLDNVEANLNALEAFSA